MFMLDVIVTLMGGDELTGGDVNAEHIVLRVW